MSEDIGALAVEASGIDYCSAQHGPPNAILD